MNLKLAISLWAFCLLMMSCGDDKKEEENTLGRITITPGILPAGDNPVLIDKDGNQTEIIPGTPLEIEEGAYQLVIITPRAGLNIDGPIVSLPVSDGGLEVPNAPDLYTDVQTVNIVRDNTTDITSNLKPMSRELRINLAISGQSVEDITEVEAKLYGVSRQADASKGFGVEVDKLRAEDNSYYFTSAKLSPYMDGGSIHMRLLGIQQNAKPYITFSVLLNGDTPYVTTLDVSTELSEFNSGDPQTPMTITASLELGIGGMSGTISPWKPGPDEGIEGK